MNLITLGNMWVLKSLLVVFIFALVFSCAPAVFVYPYANYSELPPAYALKSEHPLADTSQLTIPAHEGNRSHGAKLTPRLTGSIMLWIANKASVHPYFPASLFGLVFLLSGIVVAYQITRDRFCGLLVGLLFAGLYSTSACFSLNWSPKPFDGIAIGLLGLSAMLLHRPKLLFITYISQAKNEF